MKIIFLRRRIIYFLAFWVHAIIIYDFITVTAIIYNNYKALIC